MTLFIKIVFDLLDVSSVHEVFLRQVSIHIVLSVLKVFNFLFFFIQLFDKFGLAIGRQEKQTDVLIIGQRKLMTVQKR